MADDQTFRIILLAGFLILLPVGIYYRVKSQATGEKLDRRQEGLLILLTVMAINFLGDGLRDALDPRAVGSERAN